MSSMTSSSDAYTWIDPGGLQAWKIAADQYQQMANPQVVIQAAQAAGQVLKLGIQDMIYSQPSLDSFVGVAERITVWSDDNNVYVGVPATDSALPQAQEMDTVFPVLGTVVDTFGQTGRLQQEFEAHLIGQAF
jgi:hypothetical protein